MRVLGEEFLDGGILPDDREDLLDGMAAHHGGVVEMPARDLEEVEAALALDLMLTASASPVAVDPGNEIGLGAVAPDFVRKLAGDGDLVIGPMVDGALLAEELAQRFEEAEVGVLVLGIEPLDVSDRGAGVVDDVAAPLEGDLTVRTTARSRGQGATRAFVIQEEQRIVLGLAAQEVRWITDEFRREERPTGAHGHDLTFPTALQRGIAGDVFVLKVGDARSPRGGLFDDATDGARVAVFQAAEVTQREEVVLRAGLGAPAEVIARGLTRDVELAGLALHAELRGGPIVAGSIASQTGGGLGDGFLAGVGLGDGVRGLQDGDQGGLVAGFSLPPVFDRRTPSWAILGEGEEPADLFRAGDAQFAG